MAHVGDFTAAVREKRRVEGDPDLFDFFGVTFACATALPFMPLGALASAAYSGGDTSVMENRALVWNTIRACLAEDPVLDGDEVVAQGWERFQALCTEKNLDEDDVLALLHQLITRQTGRPTSQPSGSPEGLPNDGQKSSPGASGPVSPPPLAPAQKSWDERMRERGMVPVAELAREVATSSTG